MKSFESTNDRPLASLDDWEDDLLRRYPEEPEENGVKLRETRSGSRVGFRQIAMPTETLGEFRYVKPMPFGPEDGAQVFRNYAAEAKPGVREFYRLNHQFQTVDFGKRKRAQYLSLNKRRMSIWEAMEYLNTLIDDSDPDIDLPQIEHLLQTAEAIRKAGRPRWYILTGLIHDLGKILCLWDEPQWAVVGDTFPVGCRYSEKVVFHEAFQANPDYQNELYQTELGIYEAGCGLDQVMLSWGHDEYLFHVAKDYLPMPGLYMIRYHSCYPIHREQAYRALMNQQDREMFAWVNDFNQYDLYTKRDERMDVKALRPYYEELIAEYFPSQIDW